MLTRWVLTRMNQIAATTITRIVILFEVTATPATFLGPVLGFTPVVDICCHLPPAEIQPLDTDSSSLTTPNQPDAPARAERGGGADESRPGPFDMTVSMGLIFRRGGCSGSLGGRWRCPPPRPGGRPGGSAGSSWGRRGASRP